MKDPQFPSKMEGDRIPTDSGPSKLLTRAIRYSGFFGVHSVGPVGDFLDSVIWHQSIISQSSVGGWWGMLAGKEWHEKKYNMS